jgi:hypothetical protein
MAIIESEFVPFKEETPPSPNNPASPPTEGLNQTGDNTSNTGNSEITKSAEEQKTDAEKKEPVQSSCQNSEANKKGIQLTIQNLQNEITRIQKYSQRFSTLNGAVSALVNEDVPGPGREIKRIVDLATGDIGGYIKNMLDPLRAWVLNEVQTRVKKTLPFLFPGEMPSFLDKLKQGTDFIQCAFAKVIGLLFKTIGNLLLQFIDKFINGPLCAIEDFISNLLDQILSPIISAIEFALALISGTIGSIGGVIGGLLSGIFNALDFINDLIDFFKCETKPECPVVDSINLAGTAGIIPSSPTLPPFSFGVGEDLPIPGCPTNPIPCGPPRIEFFGGGGSGALVNPIVSPISSSIIGFDIINSGTGFVKAPSAIIVDDCGKGSGASAIVTTQPSDTGLEIKNIVVLAPGDGYLSAPDGSLGGNGIVWKDSNECYAKTKDGRLYVVPDCQPLNEKDTFFPSTSPPQSNLLTYPVVLELEEIYVESGGFGYQPGDTLTVSPNNGAEIEPIINERGEIERVIVTNPGIGFIDMPDIIATSRNGYNAKLIPVLRTIRINEIQDPTVIPPGTQSISVVDCVGIIPPKKKNLIECQDEIQKLRN